MIVIADIITYNRLEKIILKEDGKKRLLGLFISYYIL